MTTSDRGELIQQSYRKEVLYSARGDIYSVIAKEKTVLTFESVNELETWTAKIIIIAKETIFAPALNTC